MNWSCFLLVPDNLLFLSKKKHREDKLKFEARFKEESLK